QLRSVDPPLSESEITRERLSLEEAVRKVESEAAQRARDASRGTAGSPAAPRAGDALRRSTQRPPDAPGAAPPPGTAPRSRPASPPVPDTGARPPRSARSEPPPPPPLPGRDRPAAPQAAT